MCQRVSNMSVSISDPIHFCACVLQVNRLLLLVGLDATAQELETAWKRMGELSECVIFDPDFNKVVDLWATKRLD